MKFELSDSEKNLLQGLKEETCSINIYKSGLYPSVVTFVLQDGNKITLRAREEGISMFEVFPLCVSGEEINAEPTQVIDQHFLSKIISIEILRKSEWEIETKKEDKVDLIGKSTNSTTQYEGVAADIPSDAINHATLDVGLEIQGENCNKFMVATSMFPYAFYVSNCEFSELPDPSIYERTQLC